MLKGDWTFFKQLFLVSLRLGTRFNWDQITAEFCWFFCSVKKKDLESRFNRDIAPTRYHPLYMVWRFSNVLNDWRHGLWPYYVWWTGYDEEELLIVAALTILDLYPAHRLW